MILAGHQPNYLPNLSYFAKIAEADIFVVSTNLQLLRDKGWHRRHRLPGPHGDIWLTVPVVGQHDQLLRDTKINLTLPWRRRHQRTLLTLYARQPGRKDLDSIIQLYDLDWSRLVDLNWALIQTISQILGLHTRLVLDEETSGYQADLVINTCRKYGSNHYLSGVGGKDYMNDAYLARLRVAGITHSFVRHNLTAAYPYSIVHYLGAYGRDWVRQTIHSHININAHS